MKGIQRIITGCLVLCLVLSALPMQAFAQETASAAEEDIQRFSWEICTEYDGADSDTLYEAYAGQLFYGSISLFGSAAGDTLTGDEKMLYDALVPHFRQIANGERASAIICVGQTVTYNGVDYEVDEEAEFTVTDFTGEMLGRVVDALLADLPYECYWYDKTTGCTVSGFVGSSALLQLSLRFTVAENYRGADAYTADTAKTGAAKRAAENAQKIVDAYASASDYEKLLGYKNEICALVSYDQAAADGLYFDTDIDPWQLISVFDGDDATNVVCEGYSKAFMYLCDMTSFSGDVSCYTVMGTLNGGQHMWNVVEIGGKHYLADITCSDFDTSGYDGSLFLTGASGSASSGYTAATNQFYAYDSDTLSLWGTDEGSILNLEAESYDPKAVDDKEEAIGGSCGENLTWTFNEDTGTLTISGTGAIYDYTSAAGDLPPWEAYGTEVKELVIANGVTRIGDYAFYCCTNLQKVYIPESIEQVGIFAFATVIGDRTYEINQTARQWSTVQDETQYFPHWDCTNFVNQAPVVASGKYGENVYWEMDENGAIVFFGTGDMYDFGAVPTPWGELPATSVTIGEGITRIGHCAFEVDDTDTFSKTFASITIPSTVTYIGGLAFSNCKALNTITFTGDAPIFDPASSNSFNGVTATCYYPAGNSTWTDSVKQNYGGTITWKPYCVGEHNLVIDFYVEPTCTQTGLTDGVHCETCGFVSRAQEVVPVSDHKYDAYDVCMYCGRIGGNCGENITNLKWTLDDNGTLTISGTGDMAGVDSSIYAPWNQHSSRITSVVVESGVTSIGKNMLGLLPNLKSVSLPETLLHIGKGAFHTTPALESIYLHDGIQSIGANAFQNGGLKEVTLPENAYIGPYAFDNCTKLTKVTMNTALTASDAGSYLFQGCTALKEVVLGENVNRLSQFMFAGCTALERITVPGNVKLIAGNTFEGCTALKEVFLESGVEHIGPNAFTRCTALTEFTFPGSITEIEEAVFNRCEKLKKIWFAGDAPVIDGSAFSTLKVTAYYPADNTTWNNDTCNYYGSTLIEWISHNHIHSYDSVVTAPTCAEQGYTTYTCLCGHSYQDNYVKPTGNHTYSSSQDTTCNVCGQDSTAKPRSVPMFRMYDPNSSEHFYTGSEEERGLLVDAGWNYEGVGFNFPVSGSPVHRLYDPVYGEHLYTMDESEMNALLDSGWNYEGVAFNSAGEDEVPQYRLHNPNAKRGAYHFTGSTEERDLLISLGWESQGIGWYSCLR